ncbi:hypothetical protein Q5O14_00380 [Eubacteriaceae bacterium ES2]|nr:hypothetical protein Q5O14_00380 [Eubacteriaceae bacterium ES2]
MAKAIIQSGVCGFKTEVTAEKADGFDVNLNIVSECPAFSDLSTELKKVDGMTCIMDKIGQGPVYEACRTNCKHSACPVPMGILKAVEVAAGLALPKDVTVSITK